MNWFLLGGFSWFQAIFVAFCSVQLCASLLRYRRRRSMVALPFAAGWLAAIVLLLNPALSTSIARRFGIGRGADLVLYTLAFVFFWAHYQHYVRYRRLEDSLTELVREQALTRANHKPQMDADNR